MLKVQAATEKEKKAKCRLTGLDELRAKTANPKPKLARAANAISAKWARLKPREPRALGRSASRPWRGR